MDKQQREARRHQEDIALQRWLLWVAGAARSFFRRVSTLPRTGSTCAAGKREAAKAARRSG